MDSPETLLVEATLASNAALALVLLLRRPLRKAFGARVAYGAWGLVPALWVSLLWIPELLLVGVEMFTTETPRADANVNLGFVILGLVTIEMVGSIYAVVTVLKCLGQVQGFSAWKALGNVFLAGLVIFLPLFVIGLAIRVIGGF